jgi:hypothetical protein
MANGTPIKQYEIYHPGHIQMSKFEIRQNGQTVLTTNKARHGLHMPRIDIHGPDETILASVKLESWSRNCILHLGNPKGSDKSTWTVLDASGITSSSYKFPFNGRAFAWTRTHDSDLGASRLGNKDLKLVDESNSQVLAVIRFNHGIVTHGNMANIDYYVESGQELELMSLAAVLGVEERVGRNQ